MMTGHARASRCEGLLDYPVFSLPWNIKVIERKNKIKEKEDQLDI
jgi:hypothetical protein